MGRTLSWASARGLAVLLGLPVAIGIGGYAAAESMPNACPVDGCVVTIVDIKPSGEELEVTFESNFGPDVSKNHFHVWWGENFTVRASEQERRNRTWRSAR